MLEKKHRTIAQRLQEAGYNTGFIGKWHLAGADWRTNDTSMFPESYGFDVNVAGNAMGGPGTFYAPIKMPNYKKGEAGEYLPDMLAAEAVDYMAGVKADSKPFFLCLWTYTVHYPIEATPALYAKYTDERNADGSVKEPDMPTRYRAMVEGMDRAVGRVLGALDEMGLADNTLVVFTSDNGQMPGASVADPLRAAKGYLYEGGIRVPMMLRWPGRVRAGAVEATPAISMAFAPTFLAAAGVRYDPAQFDGVSLLPVACSGEPLPRDAIYVHYPHYCYHGNNDMGSVVRSGDYKYIHHYDNAEHELFDLRDDLGERRNTDKIQDRWPPLEAPREQREGQANRRSSRGCAATGAAFRKWMSAAHATAPRASRSTRRPTYCPLTASWRPFRSWPSPRASRRRTPAWA